jgi:hypothetical protein
VKYQSKYFQERNLHIALLKINYSANWVVVMVVVVGGQDKSRQARELTPPPLPSYCTAREGVGVCNLRADSMYGGTYLKFGKLGQVFEILFKDRDAARGVDMKVFEKYMHNSRVDVLMCARVYVWLCYSVDVFDAWYREMQNYADEDFINVDDSHLVGGVERPFETPIGAEGFKGALDAPSPRRSDRLRLKRMREQEEGATSAHYAVLQPPPCPSAQIKNKPLTSRGFKGDSVPLQEQGSILVM